MNSEVEIGLAFILFLPAFSILAVLYWVYPRQPRGAARRVADAAVLIAAAALSIVAMRWGFAAVTGRGGHLWQQIIATLLAYGMFLAIMGIAALVRAPWLRRIRQRASR